MIRSLGGQKAAPAYRLIHGAYPAVPTSNAAVGTAEHGPCPSVTPRPPLPTRCSPCPLALGSVRDLEIELPFFDKFRYRPSAAIAIRLSKSNALDRPIGAARCIGNNAFDNNSDQGAALRAAASDGFRYRLFERGARNRGAVCRGLVLAFPIHFTASSRKTRFGKIHFGKPHFEWHPIRVFAGVSSSHLSQLAIATTRRNRR
jgi:hypothetical protein